MSALSAISLNELEIVVQKAARGAGLPFGHAEEAARLAGWLARAGFEPADPLRRDLAAFEAGRREEAAVWRLPCLCDALVVEPEPGERSVTLAVPLLAAAAVATAAGDLGLTLQAAWRGPSGGRIVVAASPGAVKIRAERVEDLTADAPAAVRFAAGEPAEPGPGLPLRLDAADLAAAREAVVEGGLGVAPEAWAALRTLALRTLVPRSEQSRQRGAGAGDIDRDA